MSRFETRMAVPTRLRASESEFQRTVIEYAHLCGWRVYHVADVRRQLRAATSVGFPDLVLVRGPRLIFAELKTDKGKTTKRQDEWLNALRETPAEVYLWRPSDWNEVEQTLR